MSSISQFPTLFHLFLCLFCLLGVRHNFQHDSSYTTAVGSLSNAFLFCPILNAIFHSPFSPRHFKAVYPTLHVYRKECSAIRLEWILSREPYHQSSERVWLSREIEPETRDLQALLITNWATWLNALCTYGKAFNPLPIGISLAEL